VIFEIPGDLLILSRESDKEQYKGQRPALRKQRQEPEAKPTEKAAEAKL